MAGVDSFTPAMVAKRGVVRANAPLVTTLVLGVLAGAFIGLGAVLSTVVATGSTLGYGPTFGYLRPGVNTSGMRRRDRSATTSPV